ncbi:MAG: MFS transporter [Bacteroidales bacterium]|nr:MFS transporter [Bacteroidales bacterium]MBS3774195.1 MFS transporter [Bacteroidales bacterium]
MKSTQKYGILLSLYLAQSIPMSFFSTVLPVIMRMEEYSLSSIGMIQLIKIPWVVKFLWGPVVDHNARDNMHYRKWIIGSEVFYAMVIIAIGFFNLQSDFTTIIVLMILAFMLSSIQDIGSDALAVRILKKKERSMGNSMQSSGNFLGTLFGSGVLLFLYTIIGWQYLMLVLSGIVLIALIPVSRYREPKKQQQFHIKRNRIAFSNIWGFFRQKRIGKRVTLLVIFYAGLIGILAMLKPYLVDLGYTVKEIAFMTGIFGTAFGAGSAFLGGYILRRIGNLNGLRLFALYGCLAAGFMTFIAFGNTHIALIYTGIALIWSAYGMASVAIFTISMNTVRKGKEGTDYTLQIVLTHLSSLLVVVISGRIGDWIGYSGLFLVETVVGLIVTLSIGRLYFDPELPAEPEPESTYALSEQSV